MMSKKNNSAKISDLRNISRVLKNVQERKSKIKFSKIGSRDDLVIIGIRDASFKSEEKAVGGVLLFLANSSMTRASPLYWKSKTISHVCHSSKDAETLKISRMVEDAIFAARQVEILLFGDFKKRVKIHLFTDSEATLESIASSKQIDHKTLRLTVTDLKERLVEGDIKSYSWLSTENMWVDILTKEMRLPPHLEDVILKNVMNLPRTPVNQVKAVGTDIRMHNIHNRRQLETDRDPTV